MKIIICKRIRKIGFSCRLLELKFLFFLLCTILSFLFLVYAFLLRCRLYFVLFTIYNFSTKKLRNAFFLLICRFNVEFPPKEKNSSFVWFFWTKKLRNEKRRWRYQNNCFRCEVKWLSCAVALWLVFVSMRERLIKFTKPYLRSVITFIAANSLLTTWIVSKRSVFQFVCFFILCSRLSLAFYFCVFFIFVPLHSTYTHKINKRKIQT